MRKIPRAPCMSPRYMDKRLLKITGFKEVNTINNLSTLFRTDRDRGWDGWGGGGGGHNEASPNYNATTFRFGKFPRIYREQFGITYDYQRNAMHRLGFLTVTPT